MPTIIVHVVHVGNTLKMILITDHYYCRVQLLLRLPINTILSKKAATSSYNGIILEQTQLRQLPTLSHNSPSLQFSRVSFMKILTITCNKNTYCTIQVNFNCIVLR